MSSLAENVETKNGVLTLWGIPLYMYVCMYVCVCVFVYVCASNFVGRSYMMGTCVSVTFRTICQWSRGQRSDRPKCLRKIAAAWLIFFKFRRKVLLKYLANFLIADGVSHFYGPDRKMKISSLDSKKNKKN